MNPENAWISNWRIGLMPSREGEIGRQLLQIFATFWDTEGLNEKSKTTRRRYSAALQSLGGYLVAQACSTDGKHKTAQELLRENIELGEGPLICHDNERWQNEIDVACRRLHKHLTRR